MNAHVAVLHRPPSFEHPQATRDEAPPVRAPALSIRALRKRYGEREVLRGLSLDVPAGGFLAIVGRSGCGKSTLLRIAAGLEQAEGGELQWATVQGRALRVRMMFQDARLLPWKSVLDNVALGLPRALRGDAQDALEAVGLGDRGGDWPANLSGGQRSRVALARALVARPDLLLLDEPFGALDALTRIEMQGLVERLWRERGFTAMLVTHDVQEAVALGDRVVVIEDGAIALDQTIALPRPRSHGAPDFAALEAKVLNRVLSVPGSEQPAHVEPEAEPDANWGRPRPLQWLV